MTTLSDLVRDPRLGAVRVHVSDAVDDGIVFDHRGEVPARTASVLKVLTSAAALEVLGPEFRAVTKLVAGPADGAITLVGGGDVTLSRTPAGTRTVYPGAAHVEQLTDRLLASAATGRSPAPTLTVDADLFSGPLWLDGWDEQVERVQDGSVSYITALQLDGDREDPTKPYSPRSRDPIGRAARAVAARLGIPRVQPGRAGPGASTLATVRSPSVRELITMALASSDNTVMEMLARLVAIASGTGSDFAAIDPAVRRALQAYTVPVEAERIDDGSGLSDDNAVPARYVARLMARVWRRERRLGIVADALPVSGPRPTGTLANGRFTGANAIVGDAVHAKTGFIETAHTLAGWVHTRRSRTLAFAVFATGEVDESAKQAIDGFVAGLYDEREVGG